MLSLLSASGVRQDCDAIGRYGNKQRPPDHVQSDSESDIHTMRLPAECLLLASGSSPTGCRQQHVELRCPEWPSRSGYTARWAHGMPAMPFANSLGMTDDQHWRIKPSWSSLSLPHQKPHGKTASQISQAVICCCRFRPSFARWEHGLIDVWNPHNSLPRYTDEDQEQMSRPPLQPPREYQTAVSCRCLCALYALQICHTTLIISRHRHRQHPRPSASLPRPGAPLSRPHQSRHLSP